MRESEGLIYLLKKHGSLSGIVDYIGGEIDVSKRLGVLYSVLGRAMEIRDDSSMAMIYRELGVSILEAQEELGKAIALSDLDELTGLPKKRTLEKNYKLAASNLDRNEVPFAIMFADIDSFKKINDTYGHLAGDTVLKEFVERAKPARPIDGAYRFGGEEFVMLYSGVDGERAINVAKKVKDCVTSSPFCIGDGNFLDVRFSAGVYPVQKGDSLEDSVGRADSAIYAAKNGGRDQIVLYEN